MSIGSWLSENVIGSSQDTGQTSQLVDKYMAAADPYLQREQGTFGQEGNLANTLGQAANGEGPSVATATLGKGLSDVFRQYGAGLAGSRGANSGLARYGANEGIANSAGSALQTGVLGRAAEIDQARRTLAQLLGNMDTESQGLYGLNTNAGLNALGQLNQIKASNASANQQAFAALMKFYADQQAISAGGNAEGGSGSGGGGGSGGLSSLFGGSGGGSGAGSAAGIAMLA